MRSWVELKHVKIPFEDVQSTLTTVELRNHPKSDNCIFVIESNL